MGFHFACLLVLSFWASPLFTTSCLLAKCRHYIRFSIPDYCGLSERGVPSYNVTCFRFRFVARGTLSHSVLSRNALQILPNRRHFLLVFHLPLDWLKENYFTSKYFSMLNAKLWICRLQLVVVTSFLRRKSVRKKGKDKPMTLIWKRNIIWKVEFDFWLWRSKVTKLWRRLCRLNSLA